MKNAMLALNLLLLVAVGTLFFLRQKDAKTASHLLMPASTTGGMKIAWINADTLDANYNWLKDQRDALDKRLNAAQSSMEAKMNAFQKKAEAFGEKAQAGNTPPIELQKEQERLQAEKNRLDEEAARLDKSLGDDRRKAIEEMYTKLEEKLKTLSGKIGYDYILSYSRGGQILLANDSLDITRQVLELLNAK